MRAKPIITFQSGDPVERVMSEKQAEAHRRCDILKAERTGHPRFIGRAAAYLHGDEAYLVESVTETGGLRLRGFAATVSSEDVRLSSKPVYR